MVSFMILRRDSSRTDQYLIQEVLNELLLQRSRREKSMQVGAQ